MTADGGVPAGCTFTIVNEFSAVVVRKVLTRNGERLEIRSPRFQIQLDAVALEAISWQSPETISTYLETPFGPEHEREA